jgi:hypothetical protein
MPAIHEWLRGDSFVRRMFTGIRISGQDRTGRLSINSDSTAPAQLLNMSISSQTAADWATSA